MRRAATLALALCAAIGCPSRLPPPAKPQTVAEPRELRVCADPNNLPFSNLLEQGFENALARLLADELHATLHYAWHPQRRGFIRHGLNAGECDVVMGVPAGYELVLTTEPYYRSTYVFVYRTDRDYGLHSLDDPKLRHLKIGVQVVGDDYANTPPAHALGRRGLAANVVGFPITGDYDQPDPPARIIDAVARGDVDVAIAWGPLAGYFAPRATVPLEIVPVSPQVDLPFLPFVFDIAMGVRRSDPGLRDELDGVIERRRGQIDALLRAFGVPRVDAFAGAS